MQLNSGISRSGHAVCPPWIHRPTENSLLIITARNHFRSRREEALNQCGFPKSIEIRHLGSYQGRSF